MFGPIKYIQRIESGNFIQVCWEMKDTDTGNVFNKWFDAVVVKIHRKDKENRYIVCHIEYEDGEVDKSYVLWEKDYGECWKIAPLFGRINKDEDQHDYSVSEDENSYDDMSTNGSSNGMVYVRPLDSQVKDLDAIEKHLRSIKRSVMCISMMYFVTQLPTWIMTYNELREYYSYI